MKKITTLLFIVITYCATGQSATRISPVFPEVLSQFPSVRDYTTSPTHDEIYFTVQGYAGELSTIIKITKKDASWSTPEIAPFSGQFDDLEAMFSPDGLKLYFVSNRPLENTGVKAKDYDIWYIKRSDITAKWSAPINIGNPINTKGDEFYPSVATNGNLYFTSTATASKGKDDIFVSTWQNNTYTNPVSLSEAINSEGYEYNSYIAPDESFLIFGRWHRQW
ncbi:PD40 domain-containing protein [Aquimarina sp. I32.4]|uniref:PD40 domain-containing protein n=1 Tax=Aquimarina sp. I32.4 TaxID=2053903 RepID=UPI000CDE6ADC|nr:PD40 domain-containing protein [Aquimarina sp. I32.4]